VNIGTRLTISPEDVLSRLLSATPDRTALAPKDSRGIYGLVDHHGALSYVGSTVSTSQTFYERIHRRHRTGSEDSSHYFSRMYNTGRMWRMRNDPGSRKDGDISKKLRNAFIAEHCRAVWVPLPDNADIARLEQAVIEIAPAEAIAWNRRATEAYPEPEDLVDEIIALWNLLRVDAKNRGMIPSQRLLSRRDRARCHLTTQCHHFPSDHSGFSHLMSRRQIMTEQAFVRSESPVSVPTTRLRRG
jgi:hypothetical protein